MFRILNDVDSGIFGHFWSITLKEIDRKLETYGERVFSWLEIWLQQLQVHRLEIK